MAFVYSAPAVYFLTLHFVLLLRLNLGKWKKDDYLLATLDHFYSYFKLTVLCKKYLVLKTMQHPYT